MANDRVWRMKPEDFGRIIGMMQSSGHKDFCLPFEASTVFVSGDSALIDEAAEWCCEFGIECKSLGTRLMRYIAFPNDAYATAFKLRFIG